MQNLSQPFPKPAHASDMKEQENQVKSSSHNWWTAILIPVPNEEKLFATQLWEMASYIPPLPILNCYAAFEAYLIHGGN